MQIFVKDLSGSTLSFNVQDPASLFDQVTSATGIPASAARLSYKSKTLSFSSSSTASTFQDLGVQQHATFDLSLRLRGGGPKKRCAYVFVKTGTTPSTSGTATPSAAAAAAAAAPTPESSEEAKKTAAEGLAGDTTMADASASAEGSQADKAPAAALEPAMDRCNSAALRMVGECPRCTKNFCAAHRLPEDHACPALANFRKAAFDENRQRLCKEATVTSKISAF